MPLKQPGNAGDSQDNSTLTDEKQLLDFEELFLHAPVGLVLLRFNPLDNEVNVVSANHAFARILQRERQELVGILLSESMPLLHFDMLLSALNAVAAGEDLVRQELQFFRKVTGATACEIGLCRFNSTHGNDLFLLSADDITGRKVAEQKRLAEFGLEQREDFIATLTHDLKTPIVGANMVLSALLDETLGPLQPAQEEIIQKLRSSNQALLKMIQKLLEIYRYESGPDSLILDHVSVAMLVRGCVEEMKPLFNSKSLSVHCSVANDLKMVCDEQAMQRVLMNLLSNAVKFTPEHGTIRIVGHDRTKAVQLCIEDNGSGISPRDLERLFQRFWQGEPGKRYAAGTGLGLYFCNSVVRSHGGSIECESAVGQGTTFTITLPHRQPT